MDINKIFSQPIFNNKGKTKNIKIKESVELNKNSTFNSPVNPCYYASQNNINFTGKIVDNTNFRKELKTCTNVFEDEITTKGQTKKANFYSTKNSDYVILPDDDKIYKLHYSKDKQRINEQVLASRFYNEFGIRTPSYLPFEFRGEKGYLVEVIEEKLEDIRPNSKEAYNSFIIDVCLGNRNGLSRGNTKKDSSGNIIKMSVSGSLNYRARGTKKPKEFDTSIDEIETMRDPLLNKDSAFMLSNLSTEDLKTALENFKDKNPDLEKVFSEGFDENFIKNEKNRYLYTIKNRKSALEERLKKIKKDEILRKRGFYDEDNNPKKFISDIEIEYILKTSDEAWENVQKRGLIAPSYNVKEFSGLDFYYLGQMTDEEHEIALKRNLYAPLEQDKENLKVGGSSIKSLCKLSDEEWKIAEKRDLLELMAHKGKGICCCNISDIIPTLVKIDDDIWEQMISSNFINTHCDEKDIEKFLKLYNSDKTKELVPSFIKRVTDLSNMENDIKSAYKKDFQARNILRLALTKNENWERIEKHTNYFTNPKIGAFSLLAIAECDNEVYQTLLNRNLINENMDNPYGLIEIGMLSDEEYENANKRNLFEKYGDDYQGISDLAKLSDEEYRLAQDKGLFEERCGSYYAEHLRHFHPSEIARMVTTLNEEDWENVAKRGLIKNYNCIYPSGTSAPIEGWLLIELAKLSDNEFDKFNKLERTKGRHCVYPETELELAKLDDIEYERILKRNLFKYLNKNECWDNYTEDAPVIKLLAHLNDKDYESFCNQKNNCKTYRARTLIVEANKLGLDKKQEISEMSFREKKELLQLLLTKSETLLSNDFLDNYPQTNLVPKDEKSYVELVNSLVKSTGINRTPLNAKENEEFFNAIDKLLDKNSDFCDTDFKNPDFKLELKYKRKDFIKDVSDIVFELEEKEKMKIWDYFGFDLSKKEDSVYTMSGFPTITNNEERLNEIQDEKTKEAIRQITPLIKRFTQENSVLSNESMSNDTNETINVILKALPELYSIIGKKQHKTHSHTLDIHTFRVVQECIKNPEFQKLNKKEQKNLILASFLHDIEKEEFIKDDSHPKNSAYSAYYILKKFNLDEQDRLDIYNLIKNHNLLEDSMKKTYDPNKDDYVKPDKPKQERKLQNYAFELRSGGLVDMEKILTRADLMGVKSDNSFYEKHKLELEDIFSRLNKKTDTIRQSAIHLPQTKIPLASEIKADNINSFEITTKDEEGNEIKNILLKLKPDLNLEQYGFEKNTTAKNLSVLVHAFDTEAQQTTLQALELIDKEALLSTSYVIYEKGNYHTFRPQGFIMNVESDNIGAAYYKDFGSGYRKTVDTLIKEYINGSANKYRTYFPNLVKKELNISDEEYSKLYQKIKNKPLNQLEEEDPEIANVLKKVFLEMKIHKRKHGRDYNEILATKGNPVGVFYQDKIKVNEGKDNEYYKDYNFENLPAFLRKYAQDNNLPVICFSE